MKKINQFETSPYRTTLHQYILERYEKGCISRRITTGNFHIIDSLIINKIEYYFIGDVKTGRYQYLFTKKGEAIAKFNELERFINI